MTRLDLLATVMALAACPPAPAAMTAEAVAAFLETPLPPNRRNMRVRVARFTL